MGNLLDKDLLDESFIQEWHMSQKGRAGRDNMNVGGNYIGGDQANGNIDKSRRTSISLSFLAVIALGLGGFTTIAIKSNLFQVSVQSQEKPATSTQTATPSPPPKPAVPSTPPNSFDSVSFPKESCGDSLPSDQKAYPVNLYPVFIDYSEANLKAITSGFCSDAFATNRKKTNKKSIQVASFIGIERATEFKEFMIKKLKSGEIGEPSVIEAQKQIATSSAPSSTPASPNLVSSKALSGASELLAQINCSSGVPSNVEDLEFQRCKSDTEYGYYGQQAREVTEVSVKNYTSKFFEIEGLRGTVYLIRPGEEAWISTEGDMSSKTKFNLKVLKYLTRPVSKEFTISCDQKQIKLWYLKLKPKCTSEGIYVDVERQDTILSGIPSVNLSLPGGQATNYEPGNSGWFTSSGRTVTITLQVQ